MSEAESHEERKGTRVTFLDQTGAKSVDAVIADTVSVKRILSQYHHQDESPGDGAGWAAHEL